MPACAHQIMVVTGHKHLKEVARFPKDAGQKRLAESAILTLSMSAESERIIVKQSIVV